MKAWLMRVRALTPWLKKLRPSPWLARRLAVVVAVVAVGIGAFCWGRHNAVSPSANANDSSADFKDDVTAPSVRPGDYSRRVVAEVAGVPVTREELGEYLIGRFGKERLDFLINRKILELECKRKGIAVTDAEVEAQLKMDIESFGKGMTVELFEKRFLKEKFNKTLYEWKEDVIRPKLAINALVRPNVVVTPEEIQKEFEMRYGPKVECRMIVLSPDYPAQKRDEVWHRASQSEAAFLEEAGSESVQFVPELRPKKGLAPPIPKHYFEPDLEKEIFALMPGQISSLRTLPDKSGIILRCERKIDGDLSQRLEDHRIQLGQDLKERKLMMEIPKYFEALQKAARPHNYLNTTQVSAAPVTGSSKLGALGK